MGEKYSVLPPLGINPQASSITQQQQHAVAAASAANQSDHVRHHSDEHQTAPHIHHYDNHPIEAAPPPAYNSSDYGELDIEQNGMNTGARISNDGRVNIKIRDKTRRVTDVLTSALIRQYDLPKRAPKPEDEPEIPEGLGYRDGLPPPSMNIVIQIVGSRGDVQPFVALGKVLKDKFRHRVRIATHPTFRKFVNEHGLEFFDISGDPAELMAFMVKNPGLMPGMDSIRAGDIGKRRKTIYDFLVGCWRSCIEAGDGTGQVASDDILDPENVADGVNVGFEAEKPFVADAIIANPVSFAHVHCAEKLGIPLHMMFTMPWSPTQSFPHPLANILASNTEQGVANYISYSLVDMLTWQGLGDLINKFRERVLHLEPVSIIWAPGMLGRLGVPWTYCWSPALIPKPRDWGHNIDISGFYFLDTSTNYTPEPDLAAFLEAGSRPIYIGFGSIVVDDPNAMTEMIFDAVRKTGQRALVSKGWGGVGADQMGMPDGVFMLGNIPHDWLFTKVSAVVHHGGAGTTAAGIAAGRPTVIVPFFGDQPFWGAMCARAGAGPMPIPYKDLDADKLASQIMDALKPSSLERAAELSKKIQHETGTSTGADSFHNHLNMPKLRCSILPDRVAVWRVRRTRIHLSALAATVLGNAGLIEFENLKLHRSCEYHVEQGPPEPISGGAASLIGLISEAGAGVMDMPAEVLKAMKFGEYKKKDAAASSSASGTSTPASDLQPASTTSDQFIRSPQAPADIANASSTSPPQADVARIPHRGENQAVVEQKDSLSTTSSTSRPLRQSSLADALSSAGASRRRSWSPSSDRSKTDSAPASRPVTPQGRPRQSSIAHEAGRMTLGSVIGATKAAGKIVGVGLKSPMDFTLSLAQGFHNAPKLYGDTTVRRPERVTDLSSGLRAAGKEFGYGFYDGITGLVTQPIRGARKEGAAGFVKGVAKGAFGLVLKPGAAIYGLPGYSFKGIYMELTKHFGKSTHNYVIAARTAQGYQEWKESSQLVQEEIVMTWKSSKLDTKRGKKLFGKDKMQHIESHILTPTKSANHTELVTGFKNTSRLTFDERKELDKRRQALKKAEQERETRQLQQAKKKNKGSSISSFVSGYKHQHDAAPDVPDDLKPVEDGFSQVRPPAMKTTGRAANEAVDHEFEAAIRRSINETSEGNAQQDAIIERALRASLKALQNYGEPITAENEQEAYQSAIDASIGEVHTARHEANTELSVEEQAQEDLQLSRALTASLHENHVTEQGMVMINQAESGHAQTQQQANVMGRPSISYRVRSASEVREEEDLKKAMAASMTQNQAAERHDNDDEDEELQRIITLSQQESRQKQDELDKQRMEEDIVMEYTKKQSLLEQQHKARMRQ